MDNEPMAPQHSLTTRLKVYWENLPFITKSIFATCVSIYVATLLVGWDNLMSVCLSPTSLTQHFQIWRLLTSATFHAGLLHLTFNMMAFLPMGNTLEHALGSFQLSWLIALLIFLGDAFYIAIAYAANLAGYSGLLSHCAVGFSGVIFGLIPLDVRTTGGSQRSIFGLFAVPAITYPWVLLVLWQLLVPQSSFLGHLSGLAIGQVYAMGYLKWITPSAEAVQSWERTALLCRCVAAPSYIANTGSSGFSGEGGVNEILLPMHYPGGGAGAGGGAPNLFSSLSASASGASASIQQWVNGLRTQYPSVLNPAGQVSTAGNTGAGGSSGPSGNIGGVLVGGSSGLGGLRKDSQHSQQQGGIGAVLGGVPTRLDAKAAAAAAAEARISKESSNPQQHRGKDSSSNTSGDKSGLR